MSQPKPKVLAFTASKERPYYLRACVLQMQRQTYPIHHSIYINASHAQSPEEPTNYASLLADLTPPHGFNITLGYGPSQHQHFNHFNAIHQTNWEDYDLFLKIDDDDIYKPLYVQTVVEDFIQNQWDFSGSHTEGWINHTGWFPDRTSQSLGLNEQDKSLGVLPMMPPTYAFSKKAIQTLDKIDFTQLPNPKLFEDILWRQLLTQDKTIQKHIRKQAHFSYHMHGTNTCMSQEKT